VLKAKKRDWALTNVKKEFTVVTTQQVKDFYKEVVELYEEFGKLGPGRLGGADLEEGLVRMDKYSAELASKVKTREQLGVAQKLFGLPIQAYPELSEMEQALKQLSVVYDLYSAQKETRDGWGLTLWSELEMQTMEKVTPSPEPRAPSDERQAPSP
jgi:dynein heavy chain, axonemal